jgi:hypothetical protein
MTGSRGQGALDPQPLVPTQERNAASRGFAGIRDGIRFQMKVPPLLRFPHGHGQAASLSSLSAAHFWNCGAALCSYTMMPLYI